MKMTRLSLCMALGLLFASTALGDDCGWIMIGVGTYDDWSELTATVSFCEPSLDVHACTVQPDCMDGKNIPVVTLSPGQSAPGGIWNGYGPCIAMDHAKAFSCPFNLSVATEPLSQPASGSDIQNP